VRSPRERDIFERLAERLLKSARSPKYHRAERARVTATTPLEMVLMDEGTNTILSEHDADVEITDAVFAADPHVGDVVILQRDGTNGWIALVLLADSGIGYTFLPQSAGPGAPKQPGGNMWVSGTGLFVTYSDGTTIEYDPRPYSPADDGL
jgi:hypothetical protein